MFTYIKEHLMGILYKITNKVKGCFKRVFRRDNGVNKGEVIYGSNISTIANATRTPGYLGNSSPALRKVFLSLFSNTACGTSAFAM